MSDGEDTRRAAPTSADRPGSDTTAAPPLPTWLVTGGSLVGLALGLGGGLLAHDRRVPGLAALLPSMEVVGTLWTNALLMVILPLIVSHLIVAVAGLGDSRQAGRLGAATLALYVSFLITAMLVVAVVVPLALRGYEVSPEALAALRNGAARPTPDTAAFDAGAWLLGLIPANPVAAAAAGDLLPVVVASLLFGLAITRTSREHRQVLLTLFRAIAEMSMVLVRWILMAIPVAVFALAFTETARAGGAVVGMVGLFVVLISVLLIAETLAFYPLTALLGGVSMRRFAAAAFPAQAVAAGTRSSLATLPTLLETAKIRLGLRTHVADFVLPFSISTFKLNRAVSSLGKLLFLTHVYQIAVGPEFLLVFGGILILLSFSSPGVPSGGFLTTLPFYIAAGVPVEAVVLLRAVDAIPDIFKTIVNVTGDLSLATIVDRRVDAPAPAARPVPT